MRGAGAEGIPEGGFCRQGMFLQGFCLKEDIFGSGMLSAGGFTQKHFFRSIRKGTFSDGDFSRGASFGKRLVSEGDFSKGRFRLGEGFVSMQFQYLCGSHAGGQAVARAGGRTDGWANRKEGDWRADVCCEAVILENMLGTATLACPGDPAGVPKIPKQLEARQLEWLKLERLFQ